MVWSERILWAVLNMTTTFYAVAININVTLAMKHTALRRAAERYEAVYYGNVSSDKAAKTFLDSIKEEVRDRKDKGYDPNPKDNELLFSRFVPKDAAKRFNALGITVVGNGKTVAVERWYRDCDGFKTIKSGYWLLVDPEGNFEARDIDHTWFPRSIVDFRGGFLGYDLDYGYFLSKEDGKIYTEKSPESAALINPGSDTAKDLMERIQYLYRPEFATGSSLFGGTPTRTYYNEVLPAFDPILVSAGGVDLRITHYNGDRIVFGISDPIRWSYSNQDSDSERERTFGKIKEYLHDKDLDKLYSILDQNGKKNLVFGLKALVEFLETGNPGLGDITRNELEKKVKGYPVFFDYFKEFVVTPPQVRKGFLKKTAPKGVNVVDKINHEIFYERGKRSPEVILLSNLIEKDTVINGSQDVWPYSNFGFEYNGKVITLDKVWVPNAGITIRQLESGDFYFGDSVTYGGKERLDFRYAKDSDSTRLDDIIQWVDRNNADHNFYRKK